MARVTGPVIRLGQMDRRRDRLKAVRTLVASCLEAIAEEGKIEGDLASGRFTQAVAKAGKGGQRRGRVAFCRGSCGILLTICL